jgi:hypothetical protein
MDLIKKNRHRERAEKLRKKVINHYSNGEFICACCGEKEYEFLCIDHINGGGAAHRKSLSPDGKSNRSGVTVYNWLIKNNYPPGFQVLCVNCNWGKRRTGVCPHKLRVLPGP